MPSPVDTLSPDLETTMALVPIPPPSSNVAQSAMLSGSLYGSLQIVREREMRQMGWDLEHEKQKFSISRL